MYCKIIRRQKFNLRRCVPAVFPFSIKFVKAENLLIDSETKNAGKIFFYIGGSRGRRFIEK